VGVVLACNGFKIIDLGVMVPAEKILETARREGVDIIGLSGLITPSLDEMVHVAKELERQGFTTPLLIGGATTSRLHTAVKIAPHYSGLTVHVLDASRSVGVASRACSETERPKLAAEIREQYRALREKFEGRDASRQLVSLAEARANAPRLECSIVKPALLGTRSFSAYPLNELTRYIDWTPFFIAWELSGRYPQILDDPKVGEVARALFTDAQAMLQEIVTEGHFTAKGALGLFPANRVGDDITLYADESRREVLAVLYTLRQQHAKREGQVNLALADFVAPKEVGVDYVGAFAVAIHGADALAARFERNHDDYRAIMVKALADRLAEAFAERLHERVRREFWGYAQDEGLSNEELIKERYRGIRPAPGYPACPDHSQKAVILGLLKAETTAGISLTESYAMTPASAVSGLYFAHPASCYFGVGKIQRDQVEDYAARKGMSISEVERWLGPNLAYLPTETAIDP
jgi:5-methyltetrahydrofolate--homocysteine methyltransferase